MENQIPHTKASVQHLADGTRTKALFIKHFSLEDHELIAELKTKFSKESLADVVRLAIRKLAGRI